MDTPQKSPTENRLPEIAPPPPSERTMGDEALDLIARRLQRPSVRAVMSAPLQEVDDVHGAIQARMVDELQSYGYRTHRTARWLWLLTGLFGGHRYYLERTGTAIVQSLTLGGLIVWWIVDGFKLREMVDAFNAEQAKREAADAPAVGMECIPHADVDLAGYPPWYVPPKNRTTKTLGLMGDALALLIFTPAIGGVASSQGLTAPLIAAVVVVTVTLAATRLARFFHVPLIHEVVHWEYKLRLFYWFNKPQHTLLMLIRPVIAVFYAPFNRLARFEVKLYAEVAAVFAVTTVVWKFFDGTYWAMLTAFDLSALFESWLEVTILNFFFVYAFVSPIGAILTKHVLIKRSLLARAIMVGIVALFLWLGFGG
ncbi:MAG: TM2 domain-containing protein [Bacteroidota bacterium]